MEITLNLQTVATVLGILGSGGAVIAVIWRFARRMEAAAQRIEHSAETHKILTKGVYAALDGLHQLGANGPVTESLHELKDYLIESAEQ